MMSQINKKSHLTFNDIFSWHKDDIHPNFIDTSHLIHDEGVNDDLDTSSNDESENECTFIDFNFEQDEINIDVNSDSNDLM